MTPPLATARKVTMQEIADRLKLSKSTVSRAFTRPELLDSKTIKRVRNAATKLKFRPNVSAKVLSSGKTHLIAIMLPELNYFKGDYMADVLFGIGLELEKNGCSMVFHGYEHLSSRDESMFSQVLQRADVEGALLFTKSFSKRQLEELKSPPVPTVAVDVLTDAIPCVYPNNYAIGYTMAEHVVKMGHRRIACFMGSSEWNSAGERAKGVYACLDKHGIKIPDAWKITCRFEESLVRTAERFSVILSSTSSGNRPTAVIAANDGIAASIYKTVSLFGLSVPNDISVVGCDNNYFCDFLSPPLTSLDQNGTDVGLKAARMITKKIPPGKINSDHFLVVRESVRNLKDA